MPSNTLKQAAWLIIILGVIDTLFLIYAIKERLSYSGGSVVYILLGIFLLKKGKIAYKFSQFIFTTFFLLIPAGIIITFFMLFQIYTATDISTKWDVFGLNYIIFILYLGVVVYLVFLLHHPNTRKEMSLDVYDSDIRTLYIPPKRVLLIPLLFIAFFVALSWPFVLNNPYKIITTGLSEDKHVHAKVGDINQFDLLASRTHNWHAITFWRVHGDSSIGLYRAVLDPDLNLMIEEYGRKGR